jgi:peptidoglycan-associated lipoprotein
MRVCLLVPLIAVFGCAHTGGETSNSESSPTQEPVVSQAELPPTPDQQVTPEQKEPAPIASAETKAPDKAAQTACAPVKVHFALDSDQLYTEEKPLLDTTAKCLSENDKQKVTIVGNADERGSEEYNMDLGQRRARTVATYLESKGAAPAQVEAVISHGEDSPICTEDTLKCWQLNRRTAVRESCHM